MHEGDLKFLLIERSFSSCELFTSHGKTSLPYSGYLKKTYKGGPKIGIISDNELDNVVRHCLRSFPRIGEAMLRGHLLSSNVHVQRWRIREAVQRVSDLPNSPHPPIRRRTYSVPGPNYLWHVDGNHKKMGFGYTRRNRWIFTPYNVSEMCKQQ